MGQLSSPVLSASRLFCDVDVLRCFVMFCDVDVCDFVMLMFCDVVM